WCSFMRRCCAFFFFQAEDGIRDFHVTGVQTCALPILWRPRPHVAPAIDRAGADFRAYYGAGGRQIGRVNAGPRPAWRRAVYQFRSEERRGGNEWRAWTLP